MHVKDQDAYNRYVKKNQDAYGSGVIRFEKRWMNLMEERLAQGQTVAQCAKETSHLADTEGITGFMYGCAVSSLAHHWAHGEDLRKWHNLDTQISDEGERANESGSVLNPAILTVK